MKADELVNLLLQIPKDLEIMVSVNSPDMNDESSITCEVSFFRIDYLPNGSRQVVLG